MNRYAVKGVKKLFSRSNTKIRLAEEAGTSKVRPSPLPLPERYANVELNTVEECKIHRERLRELIDFEDILNVAYATLQLCDIIEGVKWKYEPAEYMPLMDRIPEDMPLNIALMHPKPPKGSIFIGENPPPTVRHYSRVVSGIAPLLQHIYNTGKHNEGNRLVAVRTVYAGGNKMGCAVCAAINALIG
ncbi:MAG: hypothetical protein GF416_01885 [Candidatus Altiarchaeales archaeon]|nr:hypothetical protein [Candidatus Altiarchaeales archaeon]MBD3415867.1 hypothetical protein [Candidatus Altiarchaeales archaeon]